MPQVRVGWRSPVSASASISASTLWNSIYSVYNADSVGPSSLKTSLFAAYNGESNANDSFGTNNGTDMGGLTYTTGKIGNAFNFNGTTSYVSLPNSANQFNFTGDFSVSCWFKTNTVSGNQMIFSNLAYNGGARKGFYIALASNTISCWFVNQPTYSQLFSTSAAVSINTWYHLSVTRESGVVKIYLNGTLLATDTNAITLGDYVTVLTSIGAYTNGISTINYFNGQIDALNIWQKSLTQSEITELYNSGNGAQYITDNFYKPTANDALNTYNGTAQGGLTYGVGKVGTAFKFNGTTSLVSLPTNSMKFTGDFSYSVWVNLASISGYQILISNYINQAGNDYGNYLIINPSGKLEFWGFAISTNSFALGSVTTFNTNTWYHVSVTKSASSVKIYVNGTLERTNSPGVPMVYFSTMYPAIGSLYKWNGSLSAYFMSNGSKIDAVGIWNKELTQSEITELYNSGNGKQYPN